MLTGSPLRAKGKPNPISPPLVPPLLALQEAQHNLAKTGAADSAEHAPVRFSSAEHAPWASLQQRRFPAVPPPLLLHSTPPCASAVVTAAPPPRGSRFCRSADSTPPCACTEEHAPASLRLLVVGPACGANPDFRVFNYRKPASGFGGVNLASDF